MISAEELRPFLYDPDWVVMDCRFNLADPPAGRRAYLENHLPGAQYASIDEDLSAPVVPGVTGRHPLPPVEPFTAKLGAWGIDHGVQVVAYDATGGSMAVRLWWLLRWLGHDAVAVLDGGLPIWVASGYPLDSDAAQRAPRVFSPHLRPELAVSTGEVERIRTDPTWRLIDARAADRFRGQNETIDPTPGHIPGACSLPYAENLAPDGRFKSVEELRSRLGPALHAVPASRVVCYCGSGVTAAHDVLAIAHAGLGDTRLYAGSWSEWITDPKRPVALGDDE